MLSKVEQLDQQIAALQAERERTEIEERRATITKTHDVLASKPVDSIVALVVKFLDQIGASFEITLSDGNVLSSKLQPQHKRKVQNKGPLAKYRRGEVATYIEAQLNSANLEVGGAIRLQNDQGYDVEAMRQAASQMGYKVYGKGNYATRVDGKQVWVERLG